MSPRSSVPVLKVCACGAEFRSKFGVHCEACRYRRQRKPPKYKWTPERDQRLRERYDSRVKGRGLEIAKSFGWPHWVIKKRSQMLGLARPVENRRPWTPEEEAFLLEHTGRRSEEWIAVKLKRSIASVVMKCKHDKISYRISEGYTVRELGLCFGIDHHGIDRWIESGKLKKRMRPTREGQIYGFRDEDVLEFIGNYPMAFRLDKVDQTWFMDLITGGGLLRRATRRMSQTPTAPIPLEATA